MGLISWEPLEIPKLIPTEKIRNYTQALVQATAAVKDVAEGIGQSQEECAVVSLSCRLFKHHFGSSRPLNLLLV